MRAVVVLLLWLTPLLLTPLAQAHDARPVLVQLSELNDGHYELLFKVPGNPALRRSPELSLPPDCQQRETAASMQSGDGKVTYATIACDRPLNGRQLQLHYDGLNPGLFTLFRFSDRSGTAYSHLLKPDVLSFVVPLQVSTRSVVLDYTAMGIEHIWKGIDHLLFVACLILLTVGRRRQLLLTVTGFTLAHSLTLALSALDLVRLPIAPVEAVIALSIVFLASEIARKRAQSLTYRYPLLVSSGFGLLHGFGFAAVLREIGLPGNDLAAALFSFNVGVEIGQVVFILAFVALLRVICSLLRTTGLAALPPGTPIQYLLQHFMVASIGVYLVGALAVWWTIDRVVVFWS